MKRSIENAPHPEKQPSKEQSALEIALDLRLEECLIKYCRKINSGNNGVIFKLDLKDTSEEVQENFRAVGVDTEGPRVLKLMKLYRAGAGNHEYVMQKKAFDAVERTTGAAKIPKPYLHRDIGLSDITKDHLKKAGIAKGDSERADVLLMDYIPGTDLGTILFREALHRAAPEIYPNIEDVSSMDWAELAAEVGPRLDFRSPGGKSVNESERQHEARKVETENVQKLLRHLKKTGFVLHPSILEQVNKTLDVLHRNGLVHRDIHERNIMVTGNYTFSPDAPVPETYLIDFGTAATFQGTYAPGREDLFSLDAEGMRYFDDENLDRRYAELTETKEMTKTRLQKEGSEKITERISSVSSTSGFEDIKKAWVGYFTKKQDLQSGLDALYGKMLAGKASEERIYRFLAVADELVKQHLADKGGIKTFLLKKDPSVYQKNIINSWNP